MKKPEIGGIFATNVGITRGGKTILHGVTLHLGYDTSLSLIGPNGAGKSTLLRCMAGLMRPTTGMVGLGSSTSPIDILSLRERAGVCAIVPQEMHFTLPFTVEAFLELSRYPQCGSFGVITRLDRVIIETVVEMTGIASLLDRTVTTLSGGEKRLVLIAAALAQDPHFLLLDEPTAGLDPRHRLMVLDILRRYRHRYRRSLLMVTHDPNDAFILGGTIAGLKNGTIVLTPRPVEQLTPDDLSDLFETPFVHWFAPNGSMLLAPEKPQ